MKIVVTDYAFDDLSIERDVLSPFGYHIIGNKKHESEPKLIDLVRDADYVITQFAPINKNVIGSMTQARMIVRYGIGVDNVDLAEAASKGIPVCNVPDYCTDEVADHTVAMILALTRKLFANWDVIRQGEWKLAVPLSRLYAMKDLTVGIVAYGRIGREVAQRLRPFKCKINVFDPAANPQNLSKDGVNCVTLDELFKSSDLISLHCPSNQQTRYMINSESIAKMKRGVMLVNTSRGTLVKTNDLIRALQDGQISAAALDVTDPEPINSDNPLLGMNNVIITSHIASASENAVIKLRKSVAEIVFLNIKEGRITNMVNRIPGLG